MQAHHIIRTVISAFGCDPHVAGHHNLSRALLLYSALSLFASLYCFGCIGFNGYIVGDASIPTILTAMIVVGILIGHCAVMLETMHSRRDIGTLLQIADDGRPAPIRNAVVCKLAASWLGLFINYAYFVVYFRISNTLLYIFAASLAVRMRSLHIVFLVEQIDDQTAAVNDKLSARLAADDDELDEAEVVCLKDRCAATSRTVRTLNDSLGWSLLVIALESINQIVVNSYIICSAWFTCRIPEQVALASMVGIMPPMAFLWLLCDACHRCAAGSDRTARLLRRFPLSTSGSAQQRTNDLRLEFLLQLRHEALCIESVGGFVRFDLRLLTRIASLTLANMLVLIQFQLNEGDAYIPETSWLPIRDLSTPS